MRLRSIKSREAADALVVGDAASGMWAFASMNSGVLSEVTPIASHTGPRAGQKSLRGFLRFAICAFVRADWSRYSRNPSASSGDCHVTELVGPIAPLRRRALRSSWGLRLTAI